MIPTCPIFIEGIGTFVVPVDTPEHADDGEKCVRSVCGWRDRQLALSEGAWGDRCGQEYSYRRVAAEPVRTVLDIGHNVGGFIVWATRYWWEDTVQAVYAYDPNPGCSELAAENLRLVPRGVAIELNCSAVTAEDSPTLTIDVRWGRSSTHDVLNAHPDSIASERVPVRAVHPRDLPAVDAMKIDAEGAEEDIVDYYPHWGGVLVLMIEWHTHKARVKLRALAARQGWQLAKDDCGDESVQGVACYVRPS